MDRADVTARTVHVSVHCNLKHHGHRDVFFVDRERDVEIGCDIVKHSLFHLTHLLSEVQRQGWSTVDGLLVRKHRGR